MYFVPGSVYTASLYCHNAMTSRQLVQPIKTSANVVLDQGRPVYAYSSECLIKHFVIGQRVHVYGQSVSSYLINVSIRLPPAGMPLQVHGSMPRGDGTTTEDAYGRCQCHLHLALTHLADATTASTSSSSPTRNNDVGSGGIRLGQENILAPVKVYTLVKLVQAEARRRLWSETTK